MIHLQSFMLVHMPHKIPYALIQAAKVLCPYAHQ